MQPSRCLGWKFSTGEAPVLCKVAIYLNSTFLINSLFSPVRLSGVVYFSPKVGGAKKMDRLCQHTHNSPAVDGADEVEADGCIYQRIVVLIGGSIKSNEGPPMLQGRSRSIKSFLPCGTVQKRLTPLWPPRLLQSKGLSKQHTKGPSGIRVAVIHIWHFHKGSKLLEIFQAHCQMFHSESPLLGKPINISRAIAEQSLHFFTSFIKKDLGTFCSCASHSEGKRQCIHYYTLDFLFFLYFCLYEKKSA